MLDCWKENPDERPSFEQLKSTLETMMTVDTPYYDFTKHDEAKAYYNEAYADSEWTRSSLATKVCKRYARRGQMALKWVI